MFRLPLSEEEKQAAPAYVASRCAWAGWRLTAYVILRESERDAQLDHDLLEIGWHAVRLRRNRVVEALRCMGAFGGFLAQDRLLLDPQSTSPTWVLA